MSDNFKYIPSSGGGGSGGSVTQGTTPWVTSVDGYVETNPNVNVISFPVDAHVEIDGYVQTNPVVVVSNFPTDQHVIVDGYVTTNPNVNVSNFPASQTIAGSVSISNFPASQTVSGTIATTQSTSPWITHDTTGDGYLQNILANQTNGTQQVVVDGYVQTNPNVNVAFPAQQHVIIDGYAQTNPNVNVNNFPASQTIAGTITANQGSANTVFNAWTVKLTDGYSDGYTADIVIKGEQALGALQVQEIKDGGRTNVVIVADGYTGVTTEALVAVAPVRNITAGATVNSVAITAGKTLRLQGMSLVIRNTSTANAGGLIRLRVNAGAVVVGSQALFSVGATTDGYIAGQCATAQIIFPEGLEVSGTTQLGVSQLCSTTSCQLDITIFGFEY